MAENSYYLGYDVGGTKIGIGLIARDGRILGHARLENVDTRPEDVLPQLVAKGSELIARAGLKNSDIDSFGISSPGPADIPNGVMTAPPNNPLWRNVPILRYLEDGLEMKGFFENDANAAALAEGFFGAGIGAKDYIYLTMSTGVGAGIVSGGRLLQGTGFFGGEFGHGVIKANGRRCNCGLRGCFEAYCGGRAVAEDLRRKLRKQPESAIVKAAGGLDKVDMIALEKAVRSGDAFALDYWDRMMKINAQAMGILLNTFNPEKIILGTFAWAAGDLFFDPLKKYIVNYAWPQTIAGCEFVPSLLRREIGCYAGAAVALYNRG